MTYKYTDFDEVPLPEYNPSQKHDPTGMGSALLKSIGGAYDYRGTSLGRAEPQALPVTGVYVGAVDYLVDENGDYLVDDLGDYLIAGDAQEMARAQVVAIREKARVQGQLWRVWLDDETVREWKTARLLAVKQTVAHNQPRPAVEVTLEFETAMTYWHAEAETITSVNAVASVPISLIVDNAGQIVDDAVITVTRTSGTVTAFALTGDGISLSWAGSLGAGDSLTIDCGTQPKPDGSVDSYSGFSLGVAHTAAGWLPLAPGANPLLITVTGGNATVDIAHYNQVP